MHYALICECMYVWVCVYACALGGGEPLSLYIITSGLKPKLSVSCVPAAQVTLTLKQPHSTSLPGIAGFWTIDPQDWSEMECLFPRLWLSGPDDSCAWVLSRCYPESSDWCCSYCFVFCHDAAIKKDLPSKTLVRLKNLPTFWKAMVSHLSLCDRWL